MDVSKPAVNVSTPLMFVSKGKLYVTIELQAFSVNPPAAVMVAKFNIVKLVIKLEVAIVTPPHVVSEGKSIAVISVFAVVRLTTPVTDVSKGK